jgi:hypothetical protein
MEILFVAGLATITTDPVASAKLYKDILELPLKKEGDYLSTFELDGVKHFGVWSLAAAAKSCFGSEI